MTRKHAARNVAAATVVHATAISVVADRVRKMRMARHWLKANCRLKTSSSRSKPSLMVLLASLTTLPLMQTLRPMTSRWTWKSTATSLQNQKCCLATTPRTSRKEMHHALRAAIVVRPTVVVAAIAQPIRHPETK